METPRAQGMLLLIGGPSGAGKSTLIRRVMAEVPSLGFSVSATTRAPRAGEVDGRDYHFLDRATFLAGVEAGDFLEHAEVYGNLYGTPRAPVDRAIAEGRSLVLDIDQQGTRQVRARWPELVSVIVLPPSREALEARLRARGTDDEATIARRLAEADDQIRHLDLYRYAVVNDDVDEAAATLLAVVRAELAATSRRPDLRATWLG